MCAPISLGESCGVYWPHLIKGVNKIHLNVLHVEAHVKHILLLA